MKTGFKRHLYIVLGWLFTLLAIIGVLLPLLPTTPFLILALACFDRSSPTFHRMLLNNRWFGPSLKQWQQCKTVTLATQRKGTALIVLSFSASIAILHGRPMLQIGLALMAAVLLFFIWRLKREPLSDTA